MQRMAYYVLRVVWRVLSFHVDFHMVRHLKECSADLHSTVGHCKRCPQLENGIFVLCSLLLRKPRWFVC